MFRKESLLSRAFFCQTLAWTKICLLVTFVACLCLPRILDLNFFAINDVSASNVSSDSHGVSSVSIPFSSQQGGSRGSWIDTVCYWLLDIDLAVGIQVADDSFIFGVGMETKHLDIDLSLVDRFDGGGADALFEDKGFVAVGDELGDINANCESNEYNISSLRTCLNT